MLIQVRYTDPRSQEAAVLSNALTSFVTCDQGSGPADLQARGQCYFNLIPDHRGRDFSQPTCDQGSVLVHNTKTD